MLVSKKIDAFMENLKASNVPGVKVEEVYLKMDEDDEPEFYYWYVVIKGPLFTNIFKVYNKNHMSRIGVYCNKRFKAQDHMIEEILRCMPN